MRLAPDLLAEITRVKQNVPQGRSKMKVMHSPLILPSSEAREDLHLRSDPWIGFQQEHQKL